MRDYMARGAALYQQFFAVHGTLAQAPLLFLLAPPLILLILRFVSTALVRSRRSSHKLQHEDGRRLPPSPPNKVPVIGHLHLVGSMPHVSLRDLGAKHGHDGLLLLHLGVVPTLVASSSCAAEAVLRTHDLVFASRTWSPVADIIFYNSSDVVFAPYGEYWRQLRKIVMAHMLSAKKVRAFRHGRQEEVATVLARIYEAATTTPRTAVDMSELLGGYTNDVVCRAVIGEHHRERGRNRLFRELIEINVSLLGGFNLEDYFPWLARIELLSKIICAKAKAVRKRWDKLFDELIDEHAQAKPHHQEQEHEESTADFIHVLLSVQEEYSLTRDNVNGLLLDMFEAGIETSYLVLEYAMAELMMNRHVMTKLKAEVRRSTPACNRSSMLKEEDLGNMTYLKAVIKETLRLHPPVPLLIPHLSTADCEISGYSIPSGTRVIVNAWAIGRDPSSWEKPEQFMPERFLQGDQDQAIVDIKGQDFHYLPFGSGRRMCPGMNFGIATIEIMLANLVYHFDWQLQNGIGGTPTGVDMTELFGLTLLQKEISPPL